MSGQQLLLLWHSQSHEQRLSSDIIIPQLSVQVSNSINNKISYNFKLLKYA